jgi:hypothetical protein
MRSERKVVHYRNPIILKTKEIYNIFIYSKTIAKYKTNENEAIAPSYFMYMDAIHQK